MRQTLLQGPSCTKDTQIGTDEPLIPVLSVLMRSYFVFQYRLIVCHVPSSRRTGGGRPRSSKAGNLATARQATSNFSVDGARTSCCCAAASCATMSPPHFFKLLLAVSKECQIVPPNVNTNIISHKSGCRTHGNCRVSSGGGRVHGSCGDKRSKARGGSFLLFPCVRAVIMRYVVFVLDLRTLPTDWRPRKPSLPRGVDHVLRCLSGGIHGGWGASLEGVRAQCARFFVSGTSCVGFSS